jgi:sulfatase modifying factor 1
MRAGIPVNILLCVIMLMPFGYGLTSAQVQPVRGGTFLMGNEEGDDDVLPPHEVTLSPFTISSREVTESSYDSCVTAGRCTPAHYDDNTCKAWNGSRFITVKVPFSARNPDFPVVCVTWHQARQFCRSRRMELPTEAQWEYAARAGTATNNPQQRRNGVTGRKNGPVSVASGQPNGWGLYDMLGNVWEWVADYYDPQWYRLSEKADPAGPKVGFYRVIRGGGWYSAASRVSVSGRQRYSPDFSEVSIGFRCVGPSAR